MRESDLDFLVEQLSPEMSDLERRVRAADPTVEDADVLDRALQQPPGVDDKGVEIIQNAKNVHGLLFSIEGSCSDVQPHLLWHSVPDAGTR